MRVYETKPKKPNSAIRKVAKVAIKLKNKRKNLIAYIPGFGPHNLQPLSTVLVKGGRCQDLPGVKYRLVRKHYDFLASERFLRKNRRSKFSVKNLEKKSKKGLAVLQKTFEKRLINAFMRKGNYIKAENIYLKVVNRLSTLGIKNSYHFIRETLLKMTPIMGVVKKKRGVKELIYPKYLEPEMGEKLAIKWLKKTVAKFKGDLLIENIVEEFVKASKDQGEVVKEKWALYKEKKMVLNWRGVKSRLYSGKRRIDGRNKGLIAIRSRGGALKRKYRYIEHYKQKWMDKWLFVMRIEYDPNRSAHIALCSILKEGIYFYVISIAKLEVGSLIITSALKLGTLQVGNTTKIKNIPEGLLINNIELIENSGSKISRAAGTSSLIIKKYNKKYSLVKLSSKECRLISNECYATIGTVSNLERKLKQNKKASYSRKRGIRPIVRGLAMNP
ncbi:hypothetical protein ACTFIY_002715, partial [Dictyostelium cf. discoideum]